MHSCTHIQAHTHTQQKDKGFKDTEKGLNKDRGEQMVSHNAKVSDLSCDTAD